MASAPVGEQVQARYRAGLEQIRRGMASLSDLHTELERHDSHPSVRATLLKLLHELDELLLRVTERPPDFGVSGEDGVSAIAPHLEAGSEPTEPEAGG